MPTHPENLRMVLLSALDVSPLFVISIPLSMRIFGSRRLAPPMSNPVKRKRKLPVYRGNSGEIALKNPARNGPMTIPILQDILK